VGGRDLAPLRAIDHGLVYHFGHPRAVRLPGGDVIAVWYQGTDVVKDGAWARIAR